MSFQAPYDIVSLRKQLFLEDQERAELERAQQEQLQNSIFASIGTIANLYAQQESAKAGVKAGEQLGKMFGDQLGIDPSYFSSPEYKQLGLRGQNQLHSNIWGSLGALGNLRMANQRLGVAQNQPFVNAGIKNATNIAGQGGPGMQRGGLPPAAAIFP